MRLERRIALLAAAAASVAALAAPSASAQIEFTDEATTEHCSAVTIGSHSVSGGCPMQFTSTEPVTLEILGMVVSVCDEEFEARIDEDGAGAIYNQTLTGANCTVEPCEETSQAEPWPVQAEEVGAGVEHVIAEVCLDAGGGEAICTIEADLTTVSHDIVDIRAEEATCDENGAIHITGGWAVEIDEAHPGVEFAPETNIRPLGDGVLDWKNGGVDTSKMATFKNFIAVGVQMTTPIIEGTGKDLFKYIEGCEKTGIINNGECEVVVKKVKAGTGTATLRVKYLWGPPNNERPVTSCKLALKG